MILVRFVKRHKKKLIFLVVLLGGSYMGVKYAMRKLRETLTMSSKSFSMANQQYLTLKKYDHYLTIKQTSDEAVIELSKALHENIKQALPTEDLLNQLKQKPANKLEIWEKLKIMCATRCFATIYAQSILCLFIKVELCMIGGYLLVESMSDELLDFNSLFEDPKKKKPTKLTPYVQQKFLQNIENFIRNEMPRLIEAIEKSCVEAFSEISLKQNLTIEILHEKFDQVHASLKSKIKRKPSTNEVDIDSEYYQFQQRTYLSDYLLPDLNEDALTSSFISINATKVETDVLDELNLDTMDLLNCQDFQTTLESLIDNLSNEFLNILTSLIFQEIVVVENPEKSEMVSVSLPFAKLIPIFDKTQQAFQANSNSLLKLLDNLKLNIFSANIYEAFSHTTSSTNQPEPADLINNLNRLLF